MNIFYISKFTDKLTKILLYGAFSFLILSLPYFFSSQNFKKKLFISPQPQNIQKTVLSAKSKQNLWLPIIQYIHVENIKKLEVTASSAISYDLTSNRLLYAKNIKMKYPIASLTKIMTALVGLESIDMSALLRVNKQASLVGEDSMGLSEGEYLSFKDLLYGLILHSANDAAETIAADSPVGRKSFIYLMNKKAEDLGLSETHFTNPTGLEGDGNQYSSAYDLLVITRNALENNFFKEVAATFDYHIPPGARNKEYYLENETNLITSYPGVKGIKTGYTDEAGYCLVTYLDYGGHEIIAVLLNSQNRRQEMKDLLDYSLRSLDVVSPPHS